MSSLYLFNSMSNSFSFFSFIYSVGTTQGATGQSRR